MKFSLKIALVPLPFILLTGCFETTNTLSSSFDAKIAYCPLRQDTTYAISAVGKGVKNLGTIQTQYVAGGKCSPRNVGDINYSTSQQIMEFVDSRFYDLGNGVKIGFGSSLKQRPSNLDKYFVLAKTYENGKIELYANCSESELKPANNPDLTCAIRNQDSLRLLSENLKYLKPSAILTPIK